MPGWLSCLRVQLNFGSGHDPRVVGGGGKGGESRGGMLQVCLLSDLPQHWEPGLLSSFYILTFPGSLGHQWRLEHEAQAGGCTSNTSLDPGTIWLYTAARKVAKCICLSVAATTASLQWEP